MADVISYKPPPIAKAFMKRHLKGELFYDWIVGPFGSAKTTAAFFKLCYLAAQQEPSPDGFRYSRAVVVRNTNPQLTDSTLVSWNYWFQDGTHGEWHASEKRFTLRFSDVVCEVLFRPLDTPADVVRVLGLEVTFAIIDEFREIGPQIVEGLSGRLGRYKVPGGIKPTNWGMWGQSNPGTEDLWWYDYLHSTINQETGERQGCVPVLFPHDDAAQAAYQRLMGFPSDNETRTDAEGNITHVNNAWYFVQPSGFHKDAENLENLPGKRAYYTNLAKGKSQGWIKQYIDAEWGFSAAGTAVISSFSADKHVSSTPLPFDRRKALIVGTDPGLGGSAFVFMQQAWDGRVNVLGELVQRGLGAERLIKERLQPYVTERFPGAKVIIALDPAAAIRNNNDEKRVAQTFKKVYPIAIETNNRLPLRINAYDHFFSTLIGGGSATLIDGGHCPNLIRALKGGWRYSIDVRKDEIKGAEPEKNSWSHIGDAGGYGYRYFHRGVVTQDSDHRKAFTPPRFAGNEYNAQ